MAHIFTPRPVLTKARVVTASAVFVATVTLAIAAWSSWFAPAGLTRSSGDYAVQGHSGERPFESEAVTIRPWGFEPQEINRPAGRFFLAVINRSGSLDADIRLNRMVGNDQQLVPLPRGNKGWRQEVDLPPGVYVLTEVNHHDWSCRINIAHP